MEMDGVTLAEIGKRNGAYLEEVAENERNLREENAKKSKEANLEKNSSVSEESKKINNTDKIENKDGEELIDKPNKIEKLPDLGIINHVNYLIFFLLGYKRVKKNNC